MSVWGRHRVDPDAGRNDTVGDVARTDELAFWYA